MNNQAKGSFEVKMTPQPFSDGSSDHALGRFLLDKHYHGDLEASSIGQMLSFGTGEKGSSGVYVAIEKITGTLEGRSGSFALHHTGLMSKGAPTLTVAVVPDSGTGDLIGLAGSMNIQIQDGKHNYSFSYTLSAIQ